MRNIYIVNATHVVISDTHPEGVYSTVSGYPKTFDSRNYNANQDNPNGDTEKALRVAKADFYTQEAAFLSADNRAMWTITLTRADGRQMMQESFGAFPDMTPTPASEEATEA